SANQEFSVWFERDLGNRSTVKRRSERVIRRSIAIEAKNGGPLQPYNDFPIWLQCQPEWSGENLAMERTVQGAVLVETNQIPEPGPLVYQPIAAHEEFAIGLQGGAENVPAEGRCIIRRI